MLTVSGTVAHRKSATTHDEARAFVEFINAKLSFDSLLAHVLPMAEPLALWSGALADGVLLCRLINVAVAETIDERVVNLNPDNRFRVVENLNLAVNAARSARPDTVHPTEIPTQDLS